MSDPSAHPSEGEEVPEYVAARIRRPPPPNSHVLPGSTPVVAFGDPRRARVATLGLNPSRIEFEIHGRELDGASRRFETLRSLGVPRLDDATDTAVARVWRRCNRYFDGNPYRRWFDRLEEIVNAVGGSYYGGSACHLDLSQWATDPTWNGLGSEVRARLVADDVEFLRTQLRSEPIGLLLLNGRGVLNAFEIAFGCDFRCEAGSVNDRTVTTRFYTGRIGNVHVIGWSTNLQSSFGVTRTLRAEIAVRVGELRDSALSGPAALGGC